MGYGMAACLLKDGFDVTILGNSNRTPVDALTALGATEAADCHELVGRCEVVALCLPDSGKASSSSNRQNLRSHGLF